MSIPVRLGCMMTPGGSHNFAVDRKMARQAIKLWPEPLLIMQANPAFLHRSVRYEGRAEQAGRTPSFTAGPVRQ